jgi:hypothetical protein
MSATLRVLFAYFLVALLIAAWVYAGVAIYHLAEYLWG